GGGGILVYAHGGEARPERAFHSFARVAVQRAPVPELSTDGHGIVRWQRRAPALGRGLRPRALSLTDPSGHHSSARGHSIDELTRVGPRRRPRERLDETHH